MSTPSTSTPNPTNKTIRSRGKNRPLGNNLTTGDVARLTATSIGTVHRWIDKGLLKGTRIGNASHYRIRPQDVIQLLTDYNIPVPVELEKLCQVNNCEQNERIR